MLLFSLKIAFSLDVIYPSPPPNQPQVDVFSPYPSGSQSWGRDPKWGPQTILWGPQMISLMSFSPSLSHK